MIRPAADNSPSEVIFPAGVPMNTTRKQLDAPPAGPAQGVVWDRETMARLDREGDQVRRALQSRTDAMRTLTPDDLKVRSR